MNIPSRLLPFDYRGRVNIIIDTPQGSRNQYHYDEDQQVFTLRGIQPAGSVFPFDFGYIPGARTPSGEPLRALLLLDSPAFVGCVVAARLIGAIEGEQSEDCQDEPCDRLVAAATESRLHGDIDSMEQLNPRLLNEIECFFVSQAALKGVGFRVKLRHGPERAKEILHAGLRRTHTGR